MKKNNTYSLLFIRAALMSASGLVALSYIHNASAQEYGADFPSVGSEYGDTLRDSRSQRYVRYREKARLHAYSTPHPVRAVPTRTMTTQHIAAPVTAPLQRQPEIRPTTPIAAPEPTFAQQSFAPAQAISPVVAPAVAPAAPAMILSPAPIEPMPPLVQPQKQNAVMELQPVMQQQQRIPVNVLPTTTLPVVTPPPQVERARPIENIAFTQSPAAIVQPTMQAPTPAPALTPYDMDAAQLENLPHDMQQPTQPIPQTAQAMPTSSNPPASSGTEYSTPPIVDHSSPIYTQNPLASQRFASLEGLEGQFTTGYRKDDLDWNIAADSTGTVTPNILSELKWKNVQRYQIESQIAYTAPSTSAVKGLHAEGSLAHATAYSGDNQDSDYNENNRVDEFSRSNNDASEGTAVGARAALGFRIPIKEDPYSNSQHLGITPVIGYAIEDQDYSMKNGVQTIPNFGAFSGLDSSYDASWKAPFVGVRFDVGNDDNAFNLAMDYLKGNYSAEANWNLREEFMHPKSFEHDADATGWKFGFNYRHELMEGLGFFASADFQIWKAENGRDTVFFTDGTTINTRLNEVNWTSQHYALGLHYHW